MSAIAITANNLGKRYALSNSNSSSIHAWKRIFFFNRRTKDSDEFWALRDISFELPKGQKLGVIGRNGAGKSTLLKILSRITKPTHGTADIYGRVASLLEVGTGFHHELSGIQNIYLNGAILGMPRNEIRRKIDEILAFAELEQFANTPIKNYSTGMVSRLAFSIAAHLTADVLFIDEVLSVGDAAFQKKSLGKMNELTGSGRTIVFVSHDLSAICRLCDEAMYLEKGHLMKLGDPESITQQYLKDVLNTEAERRWTFDSAPGNEAIQLHKISVEDSTGQPSVIINAESSIKIRIVYQTNQPQLSFRCVVMLFTDGVCAFAAMEQTESIRHERGLYESMVEIPGNFLNEKFYSVSLSIFTSKGVKAHLLQEQDLVHFQVVDPITGSSARGDYCEKFAGVVRPKLAWQLNKKAA